MKKNSDILAILAISTISFLILYFPSLSPKTTILGIGTTDATSLHYPFRVYLYEKLLSTNFPIWTEKVHSGFPIYADPEKGYLNIINVILILLFGPFWSYKILYFAFYLAGSLGLYLFLKERGYSKLGFAISNFIYYFSFFHILRQQIFNGILVTYLMPLNFYLIDRFSKSAKFRYLLLNAMVLSILVAHGHFNYVLISLIPQALILFLNVNNQKKEIPKFFSYITLFASVVLILSIPILWPAYNLYKTSARAKVPTSLNQTQGSYSPIMTGSIIYPFLIGDTDSYIGDQIDNDYLINETYIYVGIAAFITAVLGFITIADTKFKTLLTALIILFGFLGFLKYIPIFNSTSIFPLSLFRYWMRTSIYLVFSVACLSGWFVTNPKIKTKISKKTIITLCSFVLYLLILELMNYPIYSSKVIVNHFLHGGFDLNIHFFVWLLILISTIAAVKIKSAKILFAIIMIDLIFFGLTATQNIYGTIDDLKINNLEPKYSRERVIISNEDRVYGNIPLYYNSWSLFGYTGPFESKLFKDYLSAYGLNSRRPKLGQDLSLIHPKTISSFTKLGVTTLFDYELKPISIEQIRSFDLLLNSDIKGKYLIKEEGKLDLSLELEERTTINTIVRDYRGWELTIDGEKQNMEHNPKGIYVNFPLDRGMHNVKLKYKPIFLYEGITASLILVAPFSILLWAVKKRGLIFF